MVSNLRTLLRSRGYGILLTGHFLSSTGTFVHTAVTSWLVYRLTKSSAYVGIMTLVHFAPQFAFSIPAGLLADHKDRRNSLYVQQLTLLVLATACAGVVYSGHATVRILIILTLLIGIASSFGGPTWTAFVTDLVPDRLALLGFSLNSVAFHLAAAIGPILAAVFLRTIGPASAFAFNAASFLAVIVGLWFTRAVPFEAPKFPGLRHSFAEVFHFVRGSRPARLLLPLSTALAVAAVGVPAVLPAYANKVLDGGAGAYGILTGAIGAGSLVGAVGLAFLSSRLSPRGIVLIGSCLLFAGVSSMAFQPNFVGGLGGAVAMGAGQLLGLVTSRTVIQMDAPVHLRARAASLWFGAVLGFGPLGGLLLGRAADRFGVLAALRGTSVYCGLLAVAVGIGVSRVSQSTA